MHPENRKDLPPGLEVKLGRLIDIISTSPQNPPYVGAIDYAIQSLERRLGRILPTDYRAFLRRIDGGDLYQTEEVLGTTDDSSGRPSIDVVYQNIAPTIPKELIPFARGNTTLFHDTSQMTPEGICAVVSWDAKVSSKRVIAGSFTEWLEQYVVQENEHL